MLQRVAVARTKRGATRMAAQVCTPISARSPDAHLLGDRLSRHMTEIGKGCRGVTADEGPYLLGTRLWAGVVRIHFHVIQVVAMDPRELSFRRASELIASGLLATLRLLQ